MKNVFESIITNGYGSDFAPESTDEFVPTNAPAGSPEKIEVLRKRIELGLPLWHDKDKIGYEGQISIIKPRR